MALALGVALWAAAAEPSPPGAPVPATKESKTAEPAENLSTTEHVIQIGGKALSYTTITGTLPIKDEAGKSQADIFFVAYLRSGGRDAARPITFAFNGGPGASSLWLHLAALGPKRVVFEQDGTVLPAAVQLVDNEETWLEFTDLVFIDPVGTGFSRPAPGVEAKQFEGVQNDIRSVGEFIRLFATRYNRWLSPKFLAGESYGTTRAAGLSEYLQNKVGMNLQGLVLISSALDFQTFSFGEGNDEPYILFLPSYAAVAWYHKRLPEPLQTAKIDTVIDEVRKWADGEYRLALAKGDTLPAADRQKVIDHMIHYTGLSKSFIETHNLRVTNREFAYELLSEARRVLGILDGRVTGIVSHPPARGEPDPALFVTIGPLVAAMNDYVRRDLKFQSDLPYEYLSGAISRGWNWGSAEEGYLNVAGMLAQAMSENPHLKVLVVCGYYDLTTAFAAQMFTLDHLSLDPMLRRNLRVVSYPAGHQVYTHPESLKALRSEAAALIAKPSPP